MTLGDAEAQWLRGLAPLGAFGLGLLLERLVPHAALRPAWRVNLGLWAIGTALTIGACGACGWAAARWAEGAGVGLLHAAGAPLAAGVVATVLALDAVSWIWHRANHRLRLLWRFHRVHHADGDFHVSTALRFHPGELLLALPVRLAAIVLLGAPAAGVIVFEGVFGIANVLVHGNFDLPRRFERALATVLVTPALHRRHHAAEWRDLDSNYGTILSLWDRLGRTLHPDSSDSRFATGLPGAATADGRSLVAMLGSPFSPKSARP